MVWKATVLGMGVGTGGKERRLELSRRSVEWGHVPRCPHLWAFFLECWFYLTGLLVGFMIVFLDGNTSGDTILIFKQMDALRRMQN